MQDFRRILRSFERSDAHFESEADNATTGGAHTEAERLRIDQVANAQAYYVLLWAQFEFGLNGRIADLVARGRRATSDRSRRVWDLVGKRHDDGRLNVMEQVELLTDKGGATYNAVRRHYKLRNDFAHGQFQQIPIDLRVIAADLATLFRSLRVGR